MRTDFDPFPILDSIAHSIVRSKHEERRRGAEREVENRVSQQAQSQLDGLRIGAADVVPLVPLRPDDRDRARAAAMRVAQRVGDELALPVFLYGDLAPGRGPAFFRRGGPTELQRWAERVT